MSKVGGIYFVDQVRRRREGMRVKIVKHNNDPLLGVYGLCTEAPSHWLLFHVSYRQRRLQKTSPLQISEP